MNEFQTESATRVWEEIDRAASYSAEVLILTPLHQFPADSLRLAKMIAHCEANQAWLENITYQMTLMPYKQQSTHLAGPIGLLKMFATRSAHEIADEAVQIFGGRALTQTGSKQHTFVLSIELAFRLASSEFQLSALSRLLLLPQNMLLICCSGQSD